MIDWNKTIRAALVSGTCASVASSIALGIAARVEGKTAPQPLNATSHWLNGEGAADVTGYDGRHTAVGYATNHAASIFWAAFFEAWLAWRGTTRPLPVLRDATVMAAIAAAVDYGPTPKRFTPGWEFVLTKAGMAAAYGGLALGLAGGALLMQNRRR